MSLAMYACSLTIPFANIPVGDTIVGANVYNDGQDPVIKADSEVELLTRLQQKSPVAWTLLD